jgi:hypothetical protein
MDAERVVARLTERVEALEALVEELGWRLTVIEAEAAAEAPRTSAEGSQGAR